MDVNARRRGAKRVPGAVAVPLPTRAHSQRFVNPTSEEGMRTRSGRVVRAPEALILAEEPLQWAQRGVRAKTRAREPPAAAAAPRQDRTPARAAAERPAPVVGTAFSFYLPLKKSARAIAGVDWVVPEHVDILYQEARNLIFGGHGLVSACARPLPAGLQRFNATCTEPGVINQRQGQGNYLADLLPPALATARAAKYAEIVLLAVDRKGFAGTLAMSVGKAPGRRGYVHIVCASRGVGKLLMEAAEAVAREAGATYMELHSMGTIEATSPRACEKLLNDTSGYPTKTNSLHDYYRSFGYTFRPSCSDLQEPDAPLGNDEDGYVMTKCM